MAENDQKPTDAATFEQQWRDANETLLDIATRLGIARARVDNLLAALKPARPRPAERETGKEGDEV